MSDINPPSGDPIAPAMSGAALKARLIVLAVWVVTGVLAAVAIGLVISNRIDDQGTSTHGVGTNTGTLGNIPLSEVATGNGPVTSIAVGLVSRAFSFSPKDFDSQVVAAKRLMTGSMALKYDGLIASERVKQQIEVGLTVTTTLLHLQNDPKKPAFVGVTSLTPTSGQFLMVMQRLVTTAGSKQAQANTFMLSVSMEKIGGTWVLSNVA